MQRQVGVGWASLCAETPAATVLRHTRAVPTKSGAGDSGISGYSSLDGEHAQGLELFCFGAENKIPPQITGQCRCGKAVHQGQLPPKLSQHLPPPSKAP